MSILKRLELEWKILFVAVCILLIVTVPLRLIFEERIKDVVMASVDANLEPFLTERINLLKNLDNKNPDIINEKEQLIGILTRHMQWRSTQNLVIQQQKEGFTNFTYLLILLTILITFFIFYRMTMPIKKLARQVKVIGEGGSADISASSSGALGVLERNLQEMQVELATLRREAEFRGMESAWRDIARIMAHEIKNPLTPMRLNVDRLEEQIHLDREITNEQSARFVERMNRQLDSLEGLVNRFRSFSVDQKVHLIPVTISQLISPFSIDFASEITTTVSGDSDVLADRSLLQQVVLNLYKNSINAKADKMKVTVEFGDDNVQIVFADNGKGINSEDLDRIFLPYVTFSEGGSGIGLSVVKRIIESMDGTVKAESQEGRGFSLVITLKKMGGNVSNG